MRLLKIAIIVVASTVTPSPLLAQSAPATPPAKTRVYISESLSWEFDGESAQVNNSGLGLQRGGARPQTVEIIKTFNQRCPDLTITDDKSKADYAISLDHEGGTSILLHRNKIAVFNRNGDAIFSDSTLTVGTSVLNACNSIRKDKQTNEK